MSAEERKKVSKAKKSEKYSSVPASTAAISAPIEVPMETEEAPPAAAASSSSAAATAASAGGDNNMEQLRQRLQSRILGLKAQRVSNKPVKGSKTPATTAGSTAGSVGAGAPANGATSATTATASAPTVTGTSSDKKLQHKLAKQEAKRLRRAGTAINNATDVSIVSAEDVASIGSKGNKASSASAVDKLLAQAEEASYRGRSGSNGDDDDDASVRSQITLDSAFGNQNNNSSSNKKARKGNGLPELNSDLQFSLINQETSLGSAAADWEGGGSKPNTKPKGTKLQRLQRLLQEAEKKRARMKALTAQGGEEGLERLQGEKWNDVIKSARGERTLIVGSSSIEGSEGKIKNALKKREKKKQQSAEKWADRLAAVEDAEKVKIQKREGNIKQRRLKMKGIEEDPAEAAAAAGGAAEGDASGGGGAGSGRKRLYHVLKYGKDNEGENGHSGGGGGKEGGGGGGGKGGGGKGGGGGGDKNKKSGGSNRAGFEGRKNSGDYLNKA
jgi:hypothetical protein